jgi:hypothetical protein
MGDMKMSLKDVLKILKRSSDAAVRAATVGTFIAGSAGCRTIELEMEVHPTIEYRILLRRPAAVSGQGADGRSRDKPGSEQAATPDPSRPGTRKVSPGEDTPPKPAAPQNREPVSQYAPASPRPKTQRTEDRSAFPMPLPTPPNPWAYILNCRCVCTHNTGGYWTLLDTFPGLDNQGYWRDSGISIDNLVYRFRDNTQRNCSCTCEEDGSSGVATPGTESRPCPPGTSLQGLIGKPDFCAPDSKPDPSDVALPDKYELPDKYVLPDVKLR